MEPCERPLHTWGSWKAPPWRSTHEWNWYKSFWRRESFPPAVPLRVGSTGGGDLHAVPLGSATCVGSHWATLHLSRESHHGCLLQASTGSRDMHVCPNTQLRCQDPLHSSASHILSFPRCHHPICHLPLGICRHLHLFCLSHPVRSKHPKRLRVHLS